MATWADSRCMCGVIALCMSLVGCTSPPPTVRGNVNAAGQTVQAFSDLDAVHLRGLVELHWTDDEGNHLEQGDLEVWIKGHTHASARVTKFGDVYLWTGTTPEGDFTFDLFSEPTTLTTGGPDDGVDAVLPAATLRRLLGIAGIPPGATMTSMDNAVRITLNRPDGSHETLDLTADGSRVTRVTISTASGRTVIADHRDHDEGPIVASRRFARYVDVRSGDGLARLLLAEVDSPEALPSAVFDVERLQAALRPDRVRSGRDAP